MAPSNGGSLLPWVLAINILALAVLYSRYSETEFVQRIKGQVMEAATPYTNAIVHVLYPKLKPLEHGHVCGLLPLDWYILVSTRVVLPGGVRPAAGES